MTQMQISTARDERQVLIVLPPLLVPQAPCEDVLREDASFEKVANATASAPMSYNP